MSFFTLELVKHFALLLALLYGHSQLLPSLSERFPRRATVFHSLLFSLTGVISMAISSPIAPGYYMDERTIIVAVAGAWAGPIPAFATAVAVSVARLAIITGGSGPANAIVSALFAALAGSVYYTLARRGRLRRGWRSLVALGLVLALGKVVIVAFTPGPYWFQLLVLAAIFIPLTYPASLWLLMGLLSYERRKLEASAALLEQERQFAALIQSMPVPLAISRVRDGVCVYANEPAGRAAGTTAGSLLGRSLVDFYDTPTDRAAVMDEFARLGYVQSRELRVRRVDGTLSWILLSLRPIHFCGERCNLLLFQDLTEHKAAAEQRLALALEQEKVRALRSFLQATSHDLRTPLSVINTSLYLAKKTAANADRERHLSKAEHQIDILSTMLDEIQTITRLEHETALPVEQGDVNGLLRSLAGHIAPGMRQRGIDVATDLATELPLVAMNTPELTRALMTVLASVCDGLEAGGRVLVRSRAQAESVVIEIADQCHAIDQTVLPHLFEPFYKTNGARTDTHTGSGLSLAIARRIVELHDGTITVESAPETGSTFRISLPRDLCLN